MREGLGWESFFENIHLNFPSLQSFAFKFDNGSRNLFKLLLQKLATLKNLTSLSLNLTKSEVLLIDLFEKYSKFLVKLSHLSLSAHLDREVEIAFDCELPNLKIVEFFTSSQARILNFGLFFLQNPQIEQIYCSGGAEMVNLVRGLRKFQFKGNPFKPTKIVHAPNLISLSLPFVPETWILPNLKSFELLLRSNSNIRFDSLALLEFLEELSIQCTNFSKPIFSLTGINRLRHLKILRIIDSCPVNSRKDRWCTDEKKIHRTKLKDTFVEC